MGCLTEPELKPDGFDLEESLIINEENNINNRINTTQDNSRNKMSADRFRYFGHLMGGLKSVLYSRFLAKTPRPFTLSHMVTNKCNCDCDFCFWKYHIQENEMTLPEIQKFYAEAKKEGFMNSVLWGGEPLLRQDFTEIAKASHDNGMYTKIATNGWYLSENHEFGKYTDLTFVSIDAIGEKHDIIRGNRWGLFDRAINGIDFHKKNYPKMRLYICSTVSTANDEQSITDIAKLCKDMDILLYFTFNKSYQDFTEWSGIDKLKQLERDEQQLSELAAHIKSLKHQGYPIRNSDYFLDYLIEKKNYYECHWPQIAMVFYSNGDLLRCFDRQPVPELNIRNMPLGEMIKSQKFIEIAGGCKDCKMACVGNYALDGSGLWRFDWPAIKSIAQIAIT